MFGWHTKRPKVTAANYNINMSNAYGEQKVHSQTKTDKKRIQGKIELTEQ